MEIISHRGAAGLAPENTILSINKAIELKVDKIEIDVHQTKDGHLILMHSRSVNKTTNGKGRIHNMSIDEIENLYIEDASNGAKIGIPSLETVFELIKSTTIKLLIEIKYPNQYPNIDIRLIELIEKWNISSQIEVFSFDTTFIKNLKNKLPELDVGIFTFSPFFNKNISSTYSIGIFYMSLFFSNKKIIELKNNGYKIYAWTVNSISVVKKLQVKGIDGIITDFPDKINKNL